MKDARGSRNLEWLLLYSTVYFAGTSYQCWRIRLWFDELITANLARLESVHDLWRCLLDATDNNPPLYHLAVRGSVRLLGYGPVAFRLPAMVGFWVFTLCVFRFVRVRCGSPYAWAALLITFSTGAAPYAFEARPYGLVLAGCGLALVGWQAAAGAGRRGLGLAGIVLGLAIAVTSHYYSVLLAVPLAAGELVRSRQRGRIDPAVWMAFAVGLAALLPCYPLIAPIRAFARTFHSKPEFLSIARSYGFLLEYATPVIGLAVLGLGGWLARGGDRANVGPAIPAHEVAAVLALVAYPILAFALATGVTGALAERYALPAAAGLAIAPALAAFRAARGSPRVGGFLVAITLLGAVTARGWFNHRYLERFIPPSQMIKPLADAPDPAPPIAVSNGDLYLQLLYYAPESVAGRFLYLEAGQNTYEMVLSRMRRWAPMRVENLYTFLASAPPGTEFYIYGWPGDWLPSVLTVLPTIPRVTRRLERMEVLYMDFRRMLLRVRLR